MKTDIIVIAYCEELRLLQLQARSLAKYAAPEAIGKIHIILHDNRQKAFNRHFRRYILPEYAHLQKQVTVTPYEDIIGQPLEAPDWWSQQSAKLLAARMVETPHYLILDCKNHLIRPLAPNRLYDTAGRMLMPLDHYHAAFEENLRHAFEYFGGKEPIPLDKTLPTITPFLAKTHIVQDLITAVETKETRDFHTVFIEKKFTEFFLYFGYLLATYGTVDQFYAESGPIVLAYFDDCLKNPGKVDSIDTYINMEGIYALGVHSKIIKLADDTLKTRIIKHWNRFGLILNSSDERYFSSPHQVTDPAEEYGFLNRIKRLLHKA